jgi:16S rRNA (guanine966-N2)-methyltransferase
MSGLRVIAGKAHGHKLRSVPGQVTRPITDRTKEALFNIIGADIVDAEMLDLFAGTGSVGIEALSRGASFVRFIDRNRQAIATIRVNLQSTGLKDGAEVLCMDAFSLLERPPDRAYHYIYIAPPQYQELWDRALNLLDRNASWLAEDAWVIVQIHPVEYKAFRSINLVEFDKRKYGSTLLIFYELAG